MDGSVLYGTIRYPAETTDDGETLPAMTTEYKSNNRGEGLWVLDQRYKPQIGVYEQIVGTCDFKAGSVNAMLSKMREIADPYGITMVIE
jgi:hypothetical protein